MQASSLFVLGLVLGALAVFGVRAMSVGEAEPSTPHASHASTEPAAEPDPHAGHGTGNVAAEPDQAPENEICPVMGNPVNPSVFVDYEGRRIGFCCPGCDTAFLEDPAKYLEKVDAEIASREPEADEDRAPENGICPVMGKPVNPEVYVDYEGRRIGFCCPGCDTAFLEDPAKYLEKVDREIAAREDEK